MTIREKVEGILRSFQEEVLSAVDGEYLDCKRTEKEIKKSADKILSLLPSEGKADYKGRAIISELTKKITLVNECGENVCQVDTLVRGLLKKGRSVEMEVRVNALSEKWGGK